MDERDWLAERFEEHRSHLRAVAYRMLGSVREADDAVQEAWLRLSRADTSGVENLGGWLTRVVATVCLDMLRSRKSRREESLDAPGLSRPAIRADGVARKSRTSNHHRIPVEPPARVPRPAARLQREHGGPEALPLVGVMA